MRWEKIFSENKCKAPLLFWAYVFKNYTIIMVSLTLGLLVSMSRLITRPRGWFCDDFSHELFDTIFTKEVNWHLKSPQTSLVQTCSTVLCFAQSICLVASSHPFDHLGKTSLYPLGSLALAIKLLLFGYWLHYLEAGQYDLHEKSCMAAVSWTIIVFVLILAASSDAEKAQTLVEDSWEVCQEVFANEI